MDIIKETLEFRMKKISFLTLFILYGCVTQSDTINTYKLEKFNGSEVPVCVNYQQDAEIIQPGYWDIDTCGNTIQIPTQYKPVQNEYHPIRTSVVPYNYCLETLPKPVHLVEKKVGDMTICYDRNNKVELPILYCQKDMINIQTTDVHTNVFQQTRVSNKTTINW